MATVLGHIEGLAFQEVLEEADQKMTQKFGCQTTPQKSLATCSTASSSKTPPRSIMARDMWCQRNIKNLGRD
jgi:hypothetical protein